MRNNKGLKNRTSLQAKYRQWDTTIDSNFTGSYKKTVFDLNDIIKFLLRNHFDFNIYDFVLKNNM